MRTVVMLLLALTATSATSPSTFCEWRFDDRRPSRRQRSPRYGWDVELDVVDVESHPAR